MKLSSRVISFINELRDRRVLQASAAYATVAFIAVQVAATAFPALGFADWTQTLVVVVAILGFPVVIAVSWAFELTSEGLQRTAEEEDTLEEEGTAEVVHARSSLWVSLSLVAVVTAMSAGIGWVAWDVWLKPTSSADPGPEVGPSPPSLPTTAVAVLPFRSRDRDEDGSGENRSEHIAAGLTVDLIDELSQVPALDVVPERGILPYRDRDVPLDSVALALDAGSVVEGTVEPVGDSISVTVRLVDGKTSSYLMSHKLVRSSDSLVALRNEIVETAARQLRQQLGEEVQLEVHRAGTEKARAWELFHQARQRARKGDDFRSSGQREMADVFYDRADSLYRASSEIDGKWSAPEVALGWVAYKRSRLPGTEIAATNPRWLREGIRHAEGVLERSPGHAAALELRGVLRYWLSRLVGPDSAAGLKERAKEDLQAAVARDPDRARAWVHLSKLFRDEGRLSEARTAWEEAHQADAYLTNDADVLGLAAGLLLDLGDVESALEWARRGQRFYPQNPRYLQNELLAFATAGAPRVSPDTLWDVLRTFEDLMGGTEPEARMWVAATLARIGLEDSARAVLERARAATGPETSIFAPYYEANVWLQLGRRERTLELLAEFLEGNPQYRSYVARDFWWQPLHGDSAFQALVAPQDSSQSEG